MIRPSMNLDVSTYAGLERLGRLPLSKSFHMREFLYSEIAVHYKLRNVPDRVDVAVRNGMQLCGLLLERLQDAFGRMHVRSGYRRRAVNREGVYKHNCAQDNDSIHTWDCPSESHGHGATACISIPSVSRRVLEDGADAHAIAWWIVDHLPAWSFIEFFSTNEGSNAVAFNLGWHERLMRRILTHRGGPRNLSDRMPGKAGRHDIWRKLLTPENL